MTALRRGWGRWVAHANREEDALPLLLVRVLVPLVLLSDFVGVLRRGVLDAVVFGDVHGGLSGRTAPWYLFEGQWWGGPLCFAACLLALPFVGAGFAARPAIVVAVIADAQLGHLFVGGDRGIDRILRTVLLILLFSGVSASPRPTRVRAWPSDLLRWLLMIVYLDAGFVKLPTALRWLDPAQPELYTILTDPLAGRLDAATWAAHPWPFWFGGLATLVVECSAVLVLTRWAPYWACFACFIHLGIAATMDLGMFPWGMLALYPVLWAPWLVRARDRWRATAAKTPGTGGQGPAPMA